MSTGEHGRLAIALGVAVALHLAAGTYVASIPPRPPAPPVAKKVDRYTRLEAIRERVVLPKPEPPKVEPPPEKPPEVAVVEAPKPKPKPKRRRGQPKRKKPAATPPPEATPPSPPAPLVLSHVNITGGVAVQAGEEDILGDPSIAATPQNTRPPPDVDPAPRAPPKRVAPRILRRAEGVYPEDAPRLGRVVEVTLRLQIDEQGRVAKVHVVSGAGGAFDREARSTVRRLKFKAGTIDGVATPMWVPWVVAFEPAD
jgi:protein TonB